MKKIGEFRSERWGLVSVLQSEYRDPKGAVAILLESGREPLATLSVNMPGATENLPPNCFYMKDWSENAELAQEAGESPLFKIRLDLPLATSGFVWADAWEVVK